MILLIQGDRIVGAAQDNYPGPMTTAPIPEGFDLERADEYRYVDGEVVIHEPAVAAKKQVVATEKAQTLVLKEQIAAKIETMPDEDKATFAYLYDEWAVGQAYAVGDIVRVGDAPYRVLQAHTSQADWTPDTAASLFTPLRNTGQGGGAPDDWVQPVGAHDSYSIGDRVTFNGSVYESLINGNAHSPSAYPAGWQLVE